MIKKLLLFILFTMFVFTGCGKVTIETGEYISDISYITEGTFNEHIIDTSLVDEDYYNIIYSDLSQNNYSFILSSYNFESKLNKYFYIKFNDKFITQSCELNLPICFSNNSISFSDLNICDDVKQSISPLENGYVEYKDFSILDDGSIYSICMINGSVYDNELNREFYTTYYFNVKWNAEGNCISLASTDYKEIIQEYESNYYNNKKIYLGLDGNKYICTQTGIIIIDDENNYLGNYFSMINSSVLVSGFENLYIKNQDTFIGMYLNEEGKYNLSLFSRNENCNKDKSPIVIACNGISNELISDIIEFNNSQNQYFITAIDYSDKSSNFDASEGWSILKAEILSGFNPDIILNSNFYDKSFENILSDKGLLVDLSDIIFNDKDLKGISFSDKAKELFYSEKNIYSVIPSYSFNTIVAPNDDQIDKLNISEFISTYSSLVNSRTLFFDDTKEKFIQRCLFYSGLYYVNYSDKSSCFENESFIELLKFSDLLPESEIEASELYYSSLNSEHVLLADMICNDLVSMDSYSRIKLKDNYIILGFPDVVSSDGVINANESFMITSGHLYTNECWNFVKTYLMKDYQRNYSGGIPVTSHGYNIWKMDRLTNNTNSGSLGYFKDNTYVVISDLLEEDAEYIIDNIEKCDKSAFCDYQIEQIVLDYSNQFFDGKITAEEAAQFIDKDVEAYLNSY